MPWEIVESDDRCPVSEPWAVVQEDGGELEGCHETEEEARRHMAALYANEPEAASRHGADETAGGKMGKNNIEHKTFAFDLGNIDYEGRTFEGHAAVFGNVDAVGDIIHPGAFTKTLVERGNKIKLLWQHDAAEPIGKPLLLREDDDGLFVRAIISDTARGRDALALLRDGAISEMSIGYDAIKGGVDFTKQGDGTVRNLREIRLWEVSLVTFPANEQARVTALKEDEVMTEDDKGVSGAANLPLGSRDRAWDADAANARVRSWAGAEDEPNAKYRRAFFWYDGDNADNFTAYKLQFADVIDGTLTAIPRGIFAVAGVLEGARGGADIPEADQSRIRGKVASYYGKMRSKFDDDSIVPPWEKALEPELEEKDDADADTQPEPEEEKAGRVLSARNASRISAALSSLIEVMEAAGIDIPGFGSDEGGDDEEEEKTYPYTVTISDPDMVAAWYKWVSDTTVGASQTVMQEQEQVEDQAGSDGDAPPTSVEDATASNDEVSSDSRRDVDALLKSIDAEIDLIEILEVESSNGQG